MAAKRTTILIADDHAQMRQLIRRVCASLEGDFVEVADGAEAVAAFARYRPDWVLMDIDMPGVDGLQAAREIRRRFSDARIVMVTQYDDAGLRREAEQAGACAYVVKEDLQQLPGILRVGLEPNGM